MIVTIDRRTGRATLRESDTEPVQYIALAAYLADPIPLEGKAKEIADYLETITLYNEEE